MEETRKRRLTITGFILVISMFFAGFIYSVLFTHREDSYWTYFQQRARESKTIESSKLRVDWHRPLLLISDDIVRFGKIKLIYHGRNEKTINIGVIINDLDPKMEYLHRIPFRQVEEGIRLGGVSFKVLSSSSSRLRLQQKIH